MDQSQKETNIYSKKKKGVQHKFLLQFYLWFIDIFSQNGSFSYSLCVVSFSSLQYFSNFVVLCFSNSLKFCLEQGCHRGGQGTGSSSPIPYPLDKYMSRTRIHIRRVSVMRVSAYFFHIRGYPRIPAGIYKII